MSHISRKELVEAVLGSVESLKKKEAEEVVEAIFETIKVAIQEGKEVQLKGFGTLKVSSRKERNGINPKTKEKISIPATKTVTFKVSKSFKDSVN